MLEKFRLFFWDFIIIIFFLWEIFFITHFVKAMNFSLDFRRKDAAFLCPSTKKKENKKKEKKS